MMILIIKNKKDKILKIVDLDNKKRWKSREEKPSPHNQKSK